MQGFKPCLKIGLTIMCGFLLTKRGLFPPAASKGVSQIAMNVGLPCLVFSSMVPSYNSDNIRNFGPLLLVALLYQTIGLFFGLLIREIFWIPADFQWGFLLLSSLYNWGNVPLAVVQSVGSEIPFNPSTDPELGVAYVSIFILTMNLTLYGTGLYRVCGWDLAEGREEVPRTLRGRLARRKLQFARLKTRLRALMNHEKDKKAMEQETLPVTRFTQPHVLDVSDKGAIDTPMPDISVIEEHKPPTQSRSHQAATDNGLDAPSISSHSRHISIAGAIWSGVKALCTPVTLGVLISLPFSLVRPLKALMVPVEGVSGTQIPYAPDGTPPLAWFYEFCVFVGNMMVPGSLIVLGASFARIKLGREQLRRMPFAAIASVTISKLALTPLIGIFIVIALREKTSLFPKDEKMLSFVAYLSSGTPSAVNQVVVTSIFAKEGQSLSTLATFLLAQYILLLVQSAAMTALSLWLVA